MKSLIMQQSLELEEKLILLLEQEDVRWGEKERNEIGINWGGDKTIKFFHACTSQRREKRIRLR